MDKRLRHLPSLRCFAAAARHQSYSRAAEELAISQAAVSQQIRSLEQALGVKLFFRQGRQMQLTSRGHTLARHVEQAFDTLLTGLNKLRCEQEAGVLTVTTTGSFASMWLMPRLWKFSLMHPGISVRVMASPQLEDLRHADIDVAIRQGERLAEGLHQEVIIQDPVYAVCSTQFMREQQLSHPQQVRDCLLVEGHDPGPFSWRRWFELAGVAVEPDKLRSVVVDTWEMSINAVAAGHGLCLSATCMAGELISRGILIKPFAIDIHPGVRFSLLHDPESPRLMRIQAFTHWVKKELAGQGADCLAETGLPAA
ncbi:LysR substrate-binding domain-containing protein [Bowmanella dokdonensis]|uniref:LysR family transcriptional regulator n=1 Tax=Bowmanella dokdonensis TaxID=751969 RepID=A0A939DJX1_9ALTE|nr:LysR substrate-binding domain-containing protein [Bowmanella dokdonensis]MBN7823838.1 LysR family transcriptional regulator [Bowmanella dokdonensis]